MASYLVRKLRTDAHLMDADSQRSIYDDMYILLLKELLYAWFV
jgi:hypothetical protein